MRPPSADEQGSSDPATPHPGMAAAADDLYEGAHRLEEAAQRRAGLLGAQPRTG